MRRMLLNSAAAVLAASTVAAVAGVGAVAQDEEPMIEGNVALVTDYRFRGVSLSDGDAAIQGGFDLGLPSGLYVGTWGSSISSYGGSELELDLYGGYGFSAGGLDWDVGALLYDYPGGTDVNYYEVYGSVGTTLGMVDTSLDIHYTPSQDNVGTNANGDDDDWYVHVAGAMPLGESPFSLSGGIGYETGVFGDPDGDGESDKWDWQLGIATTVLGMDVDLSYIDTSEDGTGVDATALLTFSKAL